MRTLDNFDSVGLSRGIWSMRGSSHSLRKVLVLLRQVDHLFLHLLDLADAWKLEIFHIGIRWALLIALGVLLDNLVIETLLHVLHKHLVLGFPTLLVDSDEPIGPLGIFEHLREGLTDLGLTEGDLLLGKALQ